MSLISATLGRIAAPERRTVAVACGAHDGFTDLLYVLLPVWQAEFGLDYAEIGLLRAAGRALGGFPMPVGALAQRSGGPLVLGLGTALCRNPLSPCRSERGVRGARHAHWIDRPCRMRSPGYFSKRGSRKAPATSPYMTASRSRA
jgi:hypothetical protein